MPVEAVAESACFSAIKSPQQVKLPNKLRSKPLNIKISRRFLFDMLKKMPFFGYRLLSLR